MKYDVVISNPPFRLLSNGWMKHVYKHLELLEEGSCYVLICPADTSDDLIREICRRFKTIKVQRAEHFDELPFMDKEVYYYIWKK